MQKLKISETRQIPLITEKLLEIDSHLTQNDQEFIANIRNFNTDFTKFNSFFYEDLRASIPAQNLMISARNTDKLLKYSVHPLSVKKVVEFNTLNLLAEFNENEEMVHSIAAEYNKLLPENTSKSPEKTDYYSIYYSGEEYNYSQNPQKNINTENIAEIPELDLEPRYHSLGRQIKDYNELRSFIPKIVLNDSDEALFYKVFGAAYKSFDVAGAFIGIDPKLLLHFYYQIKGTKKGKEDLMREKLNYLKFLGEENLRKYKIEAKKKISENYLPPEN